MTTLSMTYTDGAHNGGVATVKVTYDGKTREFSVGGQSAADNTLADPVMRAMHDHLAAGGAATGSVTVTVE